MREKKNPHLQPNAYKFWCRPLEAEGHRLGVDGFNEQVYTIARKMQRYWNTVYQWAEIRRRSCVTFKTLDDGRVVEDRVDVKKFMKDVYADFRAFCVGLDGLPETDLHWNQEEFVHVKFKTTIGQIGAVRQRVYQESLRN